MKFFKNIALLILLFANQSTWAQNFLPVCKNFGPEDYGEDAEFRCAVSDNKGTLYFGSNFGIFVYKGEKKSSEKNWKFLPTGLNDIIYSLFLDTTNNRLYIGGQNNFGYFQLTAYDKGNYISLKEKLPASLQNSTETWHIEKNGSDIIFHTFANLLVYNNEKITAIPSPENGIFHNIFKTGKGGLLVNALDKGWFIYNAGVLKKAGSVALPIDKCYSVLALSENNYLFFFRNAGIYKVTLEGDSFTKAEKISDEGFDKILSEKQIYCATLSDDASKIIIGTLSGGELLLRNTEKITSENILSDMQAATGILSCYGIFQDPLKNIWILGKRNLSRLPASLSLTHKDFRGITVKSIAYSGNQLYVATTGGLFRMAADNGLFSIPEKILDGDFKKLIFTGDTLFASTNSELILIYGKKINHIASPAPINNIALIINSVWISTQNGLYNSSLTLFKDEALIQGKNILQSIKVKDKIYVLVDGLGITESDVTGKTIKVYKFPTAQNAKLFFDGEKLLVSDFNDTYYLSGDSVSPLNNFKSKLWFLKSLSKGESIKFEYDYNNFGNLFISSAGTNEFKRANLFMSAVDINDAELIDGNYYLATKTGLFISKLWSPVNNESVQLFKINAGSGASVKSYYAEEKIQIPYSDNHVIIAYCALPSFYDSYPNTQYIYRLLNSEDTSWQKAQTYSEIHLNNLPWGSYTLEVKAIYGNQLETPVASLNFTVSKPWWATWWAILLWIFIFILFIYAIVQISVYRLKRSKIKLEKIVDERTAEVVHQKNEIEGQKEEIESKNREITDSINYAQRIQNSLLKDEAKLQSHLPGAFMLYLPKDIVSGDFYWFHEMGDYTVLAVADCTGHGVPGAFMSMLGVAKLNELAAKNIFMPDKLLHELNHLIVETLGQNIVNSDSRDGMDIALVSIHKKSKKLYYAGANRPLYIVNKNEKSFLEIKPTKLPVGGGQYGEDRDYKLHEVPIDSNTTFYLCTDGYADQFGGPKGKKLMSNRLQQLLIEIAGLNPKAQKEKLQTLYTDWKGKLEQVDDVCVAGMNFGG